MDTDVEAFHREFFNSVHVAADAGGRFAEDAFFEAFCGHLIEAGELDTADRAHFLSPRGLRVDGYGGEPDAGEGTLSLIIADFNQEPEPGRLTGTEMEAIFKRLYNFLARTLEPSFCNSLEESSAGFGLAQVIAGSWQGIRKVRLFLISNRVLSGRVDSKEAGQLNGIPVLYNVWDIDRLARYVLSGQNREEIVIDLREFGGPIPVLPAHMRHAKYAAYLAVVPGAQLARIYDRWNARLLEQNVRVFLQARTGVNKGMKVTLEREPDMFFAYNNGITATAQEVKIEKSGTGLAITSLRNFQIVNGGQTTASIYAASRDGAFDLSGVFVQMKLSVIEPSRSEEVVPNISLYANSQNKVSAADFFSNHPFHLRIKEFSEKVLAPSTDGTFRDTKWFYERARGQYQDARNRLSGARLKQFELEYPKKQVITKTDLAKFVTVWECRPDLVSQGAQKNFAKFAEAIGSLWQTKQSDFNEVYFQTSIAKAILFREAESLVSRQSWYAGGYRANIVAYALAKIAHDVRAKGRAFPFDRVWKSQAATPAMRDAIVLAAESVKSIIESPPSGNVSNVTEWAKKSACWEQVSKLTVVWPTTFLDELLTGDEHRQIERGARKDQKMLVGIEAQAAVVNAGAEHWKRVREWGRSRKLLSGKEIEILDVACRIPAIIPTDKQSQVVMNTYRRLVSEGMQLITLGTPL